MADVKCRIAPFINKRFIITSPWWTMRDGKIHRGLDISTGANDPVYSMCDGKVVRVYNNDVNYGNAIIIKGTDGMGFFYMHMKTLNVKLNDNVNIYQQVGIEGTTGDSTGIHLHVEMQDLTNHDWISNYDKSIYTDPTIFMGIPNTKNTWCIYDGTPIPPSPTTRKKKHFPFFLYRNKRRG